MAAYTSPGLEDANRAYAELPRNDPRKVAARQHWAEQGYEALDEDDGLGEYPNLAAQLKLAQVE